MHRRLASLLLVTLAAAGCAQTSATSTPQTAAAAKAPATTAPPHAPGPIAPPQPSSPMALRPLIAPADATDYRVAPRDQLYVQVHGQDDLTRTVRVSETGTITLPLVGELKVAGLTPHDIEGAIEKALKPAYLKNPRVTVTVSEFRGRQFAVVGAVNQPGAYPLRSNAVTLLQALSEAHGTRENADRVAYVLREKPRNGEPQPLQVKLDALFRTGQGADLLVEAGDSVYVPEANTFYVAGEVEKRGAYTLRRDTTVSKAIAEAGGVTKKAATKRVTIVRTGENGQREEITDLDLDSVMKGDPNTDLTLQAQDVVFVPPHSGKVVGYTILEIMKGLFSIGLPLL